MTTPAKHVKSLAAFQISVARCLKRIQRVLDLYHPDVQDAALEAISDASPFDKEPEHSHITSRTKPPQKIYFVQRGEAGPVKIGVSANPDSRIAALQKSYEEKLRVLAIILGDLAAERALHERFAEHRIKGEWFKPVPEILDFATASAKGNGKPS